MAYIDLDSAKPYGPNIETEWGTFDTPYIQYDASQRLERMPPVPSQIHGRHEYRMQPRPLGPGVNYMQGYNGMGSYSPTYGAPAYGGSPYALVQGYGATPEDEKLGLILLVLAVGFLAYMWGHSNGVKKNPRRNPSRGVCSNPECETCNKVRKVTKPRKKAYSKTRHAKACAQPRDAENGRFISQAKIDAGLYR